MERHFEKELEGLKINIIKMGSMVEKSFHNSIKSFLNNDTNLAKTVLDGEERINSLEIEIDNSIVDILALQQPVAIDLRLILSALKINNDLERIGDHAVNIAESSCSLAECEKGTYIYLPKMAEIAEQMLRGALDSFIHYDASLGMEVLAKDDLIDTLNREVFKKVIDLMKTDSRSIEAGMHLIRVSRNLERVADLSTNIAEEVIFISQARIVKHHSAEN